MRPLLLPGLLDAARHNAAHGRAAVALFESAHVYRPARAARRRAGGLARAAPTPAHERHHLAALLTEAAPGGWRSDRRSRPTSTRPRACSRRCCEAAGAAPGGPRRARGPFLHPGRAASVLAGDERKTRLARRAASAGGARLGPGRAGGRVRARRRRLLELGAGRDASYGDVTSFPAVLQDIAVVVAEDVPAAEVERGGAHGRRRAAARRGRCSTSTAASRWGRATSRWPCGSSSARPTARSPTRRWPSGGPRSRPRWRRWAGGSVPEARVAVVGAAGFGGAVCARHLPARTRRSS